VDFGLPAGCQSSTGIVLSPVPEEGLVDVLATEQSTANPMQTYGRPALNPAGRPVHTEGHELSRAVVSSGAESRPELL
jgi:hypothetical protein